MQIAITGATGLVGKAATERLTKAGHTVIPMVRRKSADSTGIYWNPETGDIDAQSLEGFDALIHLAGENIAGARWTPEHKARVLDSRVKGTTLISSTLARLQRGPRTLISASAIGYYGARGDEELVEDDRPGGGWMSDVVVSWEAANTPAIEAGLRVAMLRIGIVLARDGGALKEMMLPFSLGVGGVVGSGNQYMSWVALKDVAEIIRYTLDTDLLRGPINTTAPRPVTNREFTKALGKALHRPTVLPVPSFAIKTLFGEMGDALLLSGARVVPAKLKAAGYTFWHHDVQSAIDAALVSS